MQLTDKVFIVTGGASGLGVAVTQMLVDNDARVLIADIDIEAGNETARILGQSVTFCKTDVRSETDGVRAVSTTLATYGHVHGIVNCAGVAPAERVLGKDRIHSLDSFLQTLSINLTGTFNMCRLAANAIQNEEPDSNGERGIIINTASIAAFDGQIGQVAYSASKGGIAGMTLPLARELARFGIRAVSIAPGIFETPMMGRMPDVVRESLGKDVPFPPRLGRPYEYAALVRHICENSMLNGEVIRLDGALRMQP